MEWTAQYWNPLWEARGQFSKVICQRWEGARCPGRCIGRRLCLIVDGADPKLDLRDAERLVKRLDQKSWSSASCSMPRRRLWRTLIRTRLSSGRVTGFVCKTELKAPAGRSPYQIVQFSSRSAECQRTSYAQGASGTEKAILQDLAIWPISACAPRRRTCMTRWVPARRSARLSPSW